MEPPATTSKKYNPCCTVPQETSNCHLTSYDKLHPACADVPYQRGPRDQRSALPRTSTPNQDRPARLWSIASSQPTHQRPERTGPSSPVVHPAPRGSCCSFQWQEGCQNTGSAGCQRCHGLPKRASGKQSPATINYRCVSSVLLLRLSNLLLSSL